MYAPDTPCMYVRLFVCVWVFVHVWVGGILTVMVMSVTHLKVFNLIANNRGVRGVGGVDGRRIVISSRYQPFKFFFLNCKQLP